MTFNDTAAIMLGLLGGYWVVEALLNRRAPPSQPSDTPPPVSQDEAYRNYIAAHWFRILGVEEESTPGQITASYQQLCEQYHPDKVAHLDEEFRRLASFKWQQLQDAYTYAMNRST